MSNFYVSAAGLPPPPGSVTNLTPDLGATVVPDGAGNINVTGLPTGVNQSTLDSNFETFNAGTSTMQVAHRYQGVGTTIGASTTTLITIPVTAASTMSVSCTLAGIEATIPSGVGGSIDGLVFRGAGAATFIASANKYIAESNPLIAGCDLNVSTSANNLIITVTGIAGFTIEWYAIATIVQKTFI